MLRRNVLLHRLVAGLLAASLLVPSSALASACDAGTQARLDFLETRLDEGQRNANWWWKGWLGVFMIGAVVQGANAGLENDGGQKADYLFSVGKSLLGVADLTFRPLVAKDGAEAMRLIAMDSEASCARRLALAERTMRKAAEQADSRLSWTRHLSGLALNLGVAVLVAEVWDEESTAWTSFGISQTFTEAHIWTQPWRATHDWSAYRTQFDGEVTVAQPPAPRWQLVAGARGLGFARTF